MIYYPALIEASTDGYSLLFPDVPGCVTTGRDITELMAHAIEALSLHLEGVIADGEPFPLPGDLSDELPDWIEGQPGDFVRTVVPLELSAATTPASELIRAAVDQGINTGTSVDQTIERIQARRLGKKRGHRRAFFGGGRVELRNSPEEFAKTLAEFQATEALLAGYHVIQGPKAKRTGSASRPRAVAR